MLYKQQYLLFCENIRLLQFATDANPLQQRNCVGGCERVQGCDITKFKLLQR